MSIEKDVEEKKKRYEESKNNLERNPLSEKNQREYDKAKKDFFELCAEFLAELLSD